MKQKENTIKIVFFGDDNKKIVISVPINDILLASMVLHESLLKKD